MIFVYGERSCAKLDTVHPNLDDTMRLALSRSPYDITIIHGWRGELIQNALFESGASTKRWPESRHNKSDDIEMIDRLEHSDAVDFGPWVNGRVPWEDTHIFAFVAGIIVAAGADLGHRIRWGGDWDSDGSSKDQRLLDWGHVEIMHGE